MLSLAWGVSGREVQRTLGRGVPGFRRVGRDHYRMAGPLTAARLRRVRPLDPRLPVAVWMSGGCCLWQAARLCSGAKLAEALTRAAPHMREARVVLLALETRMARDFKSPRRDYYFWRQETAATFERYRPKIKAEMLEAELEPRFVEVRNSILRIINSGGVTPTREQSVADMCISSRTHFTRYRRQTWLRAMRDARAFVEVRGPVGVILEAIERLAEAGVDASPDDVAEELGYGRAEIMFNAFKREEYEEAFELFERGTIARPMSQPQKSKDTGQPDRDVSVKQGESRPI